MPDAIPSHLPIATRTIGHYLSALASSEPTPGGGSVAGLVGALGASLGLMVIAHTETEEASIGHQLEIAHSTLEALKARFTSLAEEDERVFQGYQDAVGLPKRSRAEYEERREVMQMALKGAARVPMQLCEAAVELGEVMVAVQQHGNPNLLSDAQIAVLCATMCFEGARITANVNLAMIRDDVWITHTANRLESLSNRLQHLVDGSSS
jgi:formiminotetrahydrofolate cyclodeaminase